MFPFSNIEPVENEKIETLKKKCREIVSEIEKERESERAKRKFSWKNFTILVLATIVPLLMIWLNHRIFSPTSMWSWYYWIK